MSTFDQHLEQYAASAPHPRFVRWLFRGMKRNASQALLDTGDKRRLGRDDAMAFYIACLFKHCSQDGVLVVCDGKASVEVLRHNLERYLDRFGVGHACLDRCVIGTADHWPDKQFTATDVFVLDIDRLDDAFFHRVIVPVMSLPGTKTTFLRQRRNGRQIRYKKEAVPIQMYEAPGASLLLWGLLLLGGALVVGLLLE